MVVFKQIYENGFIYNPSAMTSDIPDPTLTPDIIGGTGDMPNYPLPIDISEHASFDTTVKRLPTDFGSVKFTAVLEKRWVNGAGDYYTNRCQHSTYHEYLRQEEIYNSFSIRVHDDYIPDSHEMIFYNFGGVGEGALSFRINNGHFYVSISRDDENTLTNRIVFVIGEVIPGQWHDFIIYAKLSKITENGRLVIWLDNQLARLYNPTTFLQWNVPTTTTTGVQAQYTAFPAKGFLNAKIDGFDVFDWKGFSFGGDFSVGVDHRWRTGLYKSGWNTNYNTSTGEILPGTYVEGDPLFIPSDERTEVVWYSNVKWQPVNSPMGIIDSNTILRSLNVTGEVPTELPVDFVTVEILSPEDDSVFSVLDTIEVETTSGSGTVELKANGNVIGSKTEEPYTFALPVIPKNGSVVDLPFNGNLHDWGIGLHDSVAVNPDDVQYVEGVRGQAISLGNNELHAQKSYLDLSNAGLLSEIDNQFTIAFWLKSPTGSGLNPYVLSSYSTGGSGIGIRAVTAGVDGSLYNSSGIATTLRTGSGHTVSTTDFNHFALTYDGDWLRWYYNFDVSSELQVGDIDISATGNWYINAAPNQAGRQNIQLDDFRIYNYAVSEDDIASTAEDNFLGQIEMVAISGGLESIPVIVNIVYATATVNVSVDGNGTVTGAGTYEVGEDVTLVAIPDVGYRFVRWSNDVTDNPYTFTVTSDVTLQAVFEQDEPIPSVIVVKGKFRIV